MASGNTILSGRAGPFPLRVRPLLPQQVPGKCSYFREWLVSRGRAAFETAIQNPDSLATLTDPERDDYEFEDLGYVARQVYEELTGKEMDPAETSWPAEPNGREWDFDDGEQIARKLPKLAAIYLR
jgi:hypothetical protein